MAGIIPSTVDTILFDLDGTLLPMDQDAFVGLYLKAIGKTFGPKGFDPRQFAGAILKGTEAMYANDGTKTNRERFFETFSALMGEDMILREPEFEEFYKTNFREAKAACGEEPLCRKAVELLREKGYTLILATNPLFPSVATYERMAWNGFVPSDFALVTTYEEETFCKPNPKYFLSILERFGKKPEQCMMVGNDVGEDMVAVSLGLSGYVITDNLLNRQNKPMEGFLSGNYQEFYDFAKALPACGA